MFTRFKHLSRLYIIAGVLLLCIANVSAQNNIHYSHRSRLYENREWGEWFNLYTEIKYQSDGSIWFKTEAYTTILTIIDKEIKQEEQIGADGVTHLLNSVLCIDQNDDPCVLTTDTYSIQGKGYANYFIFYSNCGMEFQVQTLTLK